MATAVTTVPRTPLTDEQWAEIYATGRVYRTLIEAGEPLKASDIVRRVDIPQMDVRLARVILASSPHITASADRRWTLWTRFLDVNNTFDTNLQRILNTYGHPIPFVPLSQELEAVYGRPAEIYQEMLPRLVRNSPFYFQVGEDAVALTSWLLEVKWDNDAEVLYDNFLHDDDVFPYMEVAETVGLHPDNPASFLALLDAVGKPISNKALQFLGWRADKDHFEAEALFNALWQESGATLLSNQTWAGTEAITRFVEKFPILAQREISDEMEAEAQETAKPLVIGDQEREQLLQVLLESDETVFADRLLENVFEITPDYRTYAEDLQTVVETLLSDDRVAWVGAKRFRPQGTIPPYVFSTPGLLELSTAQFVDEEGEILDQFLEEDGFDGGLERDILSVFAQDVLDEEPLDVPDPNPPSNARAVIKYHHKQIGTMPLCQFPQGFFPPTPAILEAEFALPGGHLAQVWVNNETRLLYGLLDWFERIPIDSGATFTLERQAPDRYVVGYNDESEPTMFISRNRINELLALQERAEADRLSTYEILREIMEHYRKGIEFLTLHTEVNVVRRVPRRLVASLLSEYHCFFQRGGAWVYDAKKLSQGFDKSKRKYLLRQ